MRAMASSRPSFAKGGRSVRELHVRASDECVSRQKTNQPDRTQYTPTHHAAAPALSLQRIRKVKHRLLHLRPRVSACPMAFLTELAPFFLHATIRF
eukprot:scaffold27697_cov54-Phaeocystis_antarctica.AAC.2